MLLYSLKDSFVHPIEALVHPDEVLIHPIEVLVYPLESLNRLFLPFFGFLPKFLELDFEFLECAPLRSRYVINRCDVEDNVSGEFSDSFGEFRLRARYEPIVLSARLYHVGG